MREINIQNLRAALQALAGGSNPLLENLVAAADSNGQNDAEDQILTDAEAHLYLQRAQQALQEIQTQRSALTGPLSAVIFRAQENNLSPFTTRLLISAANSDANGLATQLSAGELEHLMVSLNLFLRLSPNENSVFEKAEELNQIFPNSLSNEDYTNRNQTQFCTPLLTAGLGEDFNFDLERYSEPGFTLRRPDSSRLPDENFYAAQYRSERVLEDLEKMDAGYTRSERLYANRDALIGAGSFITETFGINLREHYTDQAERAHHDRQAAIQTLRELLRHPPRAIADRPNILTALEYLRIHRRPEYEILTGPHLLAVELYSIQSIPNRSDREWARFRFVQQHLRRGLVPLEEGFPNIDFAHQILEDLKNHAVDPALREQARFLFEVSSGNAVHDARGNLLQEGHAHFGIDPREWFHNASDAQRLLIEGDAAVEIGTFIAMGGVFKLGGLGLRFLGVRALLALEALSPEAKEIPRLLRWLARLGGVESRIALARVEARIAAEALVAATEETALVAERQLLQIYRGLAEKVFRLSPNRLSLRVLESIENALAPLSANTPWPILLYQWGSRSLRALPFGENFLARGLRYSLGRMPTPYEVLKPLNAAGMALGLAQGILRYFSPPLYGTQPNTEAADNE